MKTFNLSDFSLICVYFHDLHPAFDFIVKILSSSEEIPISFSFFLFSEGFPIENSLNYGFMEIGFLPEVITKICLELGEFSMSFVMVFS
jgi:hypothetical protein